MRYLHVPVVDITEVVPRKKLDPRDFTLARRQPAVAITVDVPSAEKPPAEKPAPPAGIKPAAGSKPAVFDGWDEVFLR